MKAEIESKGLKLTKIIVGVVVAITIIACLIVILVSNNDKTYNYAVGEKCTYLGWEITTNNVSVVDNAENTNININTTVKNIAESNQEFLGYFMPLAITLVCATESNNYSYNLSFNIDNNLFNSFSPLESQTDNLTFIVPDETINSSTKITLKISKNSQKANEFHCYDITSYIQ